MADDFFASPPPEPPRAGAAVHHAGAPLASRMRPRTLVEYVGQQHILAEGKLLRTFAGHTDRLGRIAFHPMGQHLGGSAAAVCLGLAPEAGLAGYRRTV